ncbi:MAG TPA: glycosyltransferase [Nitrospirota bacterium]
MGEFPFISVIIPVKPGGRVRSIDALKAVDYPRDRMEVLVAEGRQPSVQRNAAARQATGEILYFLDDDSLVTPELFKVAAKRFDDPKVSVVGGPIITPPTDSFLQKSFGLALSSPFGGSTIRARYKKLGAERPGTENELILANLAFRRDVFLAAGGLNEKLYPNEENELMNRLQDEGHIFLYVPDAFIWRSQRTSYKLYCRQVFTYGRGRMDQNYAHPEGFKPLHMAPSLFLLYTLSMPFICWKPYLLPFGAYLALNLIASAASAVEGKSPLQFFVMPFMFLTLHLGYGAGFLRGLIKGLLPKPAPAPTCPVTVARREV